MNFLDWIVIFESMVKGNTGITTGNVAPLCVCVFPTSREKVLRYKVSIMWMSMVSMSEFIFQG